MKLFAVALLALWIPSCNALAQEPNTTAGKITASSGNVAAATATASLAATNGLMNYVCGFNISGGGATGASVISPTLTGLNGGTMTFSIGVVAGATLGTPVLNVHFYPCQQATALNTAITLTAPSFGAGNTNATANIWGYRLPY
jgi:hypothetical protein